MTIKNILVPYDGTGLSRKALGLAKDIARNFNANLVLLMVIPTFQPISDSVFSGTAIASYQQIVNELKKKGEKEISKRTVKCREEGVKASYKIVYDDVPSAILRQAKKSKINMIIMGSRKLTGLASIKRLGSTARYVSEHASCPVTLVH